MAWIKRNLVFVIIGILAIGLLGAAGFYNYSGWSHNTASFAKLNEIYDTLKSLTGKKPSPGNDKVNNIEAAKAQEVQLREWIQQAGNYFQPIAPIPNTGTNAVSSEAFAAALRRSIDQMQHEADAASVTLPPRYSFAFEAQRVLVKFSPSSLGSLAQQLGEVRAIAEVLFAARVNSLDGIQRVRVSEDDSAGPQADYFEGSSATNNLAVLTPYLITFRSFTPEVGEVLAGFASSPHGFIVKSINVQPAGAYATASPDAPGMPGSPFAPMRQQPGMPPVGGFPPTVAGTPGRGGLPTVLDEQLLRVTLVVEIVKLLPKR
ncbi:MAG: Amuc_1100 family pilus-like protein [Verrucomicrobiia bacterium]